MPGPSERHRPGSMWWTAARSGVSAALTGIAIAVVVVVVCWLPGAGTAGHPMSAIRAGLLAFLDGQGAGLTIDGVATGFVPLGMLGIISVIAWRAGRALAEALDEANESAPGRVLRLAGVQVGCYLLVCAVLLGLSRLGSSHASALPTLLAALLVFGLSAGLALVLGTDLRAYAHDRIPMPVRHGARAAGAVIAVYLAAGALLSVGSLVLHAGRVMDLSRQVGGGLSGLPVLMLGVLCAPNAVVGATSYLAGPGFAVGSGTTVNAFSSSHGLLPAFPILGALPTGHGADPLVLGLMALTPVLAGLACAMLVRRGGCTDLGPACVAVVAAGGLAGSAMLVLGWLAGGSVGPGRLRVVGPSPWQLGLAVALESILLALAALSTRWLWQRLHGSPAVAEPAAGEQLVTSAS